MLKIISDTPKVNSVSYKPEIDGLRAIAVIFVILFHINPNGLLPGGFIGVDVFFVISGYLITGIIYNQTKENRFNYIDFISARIARLYPALIVTIIITIFLGSLLYSTNYFTNAVSTSLYSFLSISNILFSKEKGYWDLDSNTNPFLHTWSLNKISK
ncbi:acyltransferase family protein, partial [Xenorhabdus szentirmaii]|uniref:acyltransferase family protein n=1 Tax=Xenorhabdus szentirmaii TaxID=290112 RepID=UPI0019C2E332